MEAKEHSVVFIPTLNSNSHIKNSSNSRAS